VSELFHVTLDIKLQSIKHHGVDPKYATGKMIASWWVAENRVVWALAHVSAKWEMSVDRLVVLSIHQSGGVFFRWSQPDTWYARGVIHPEFIWGWERFVKPEV